MNALSTKCKAPDRAARPVLNMTMDRIVPAQMPLSTSVELYCGWIMERPESAEIAHAAVGAVYAEVFPVNRGRYAA
jgi:hypothetical protein